MDFSYNRQNSKNSGFNFDFSHKIKSHPKYGSELQSDTKTPLSVVSTPDDITFVGERKKSIRRTAPRTTRPKTKYVKATSRRVAKKKKTLQLSFVEKLAWLSIGGLLLRLVFMENGIVDFYKMENILSERQNQIAFVEEENVELTNDIHRIKTNARYQREIAREHLGVISSDEYLILFAKDSVL